MLSVRKAQLGLPDLRGRKVTLVRKAPLERQVLSDHRVQLEQRDR